MSKDPAFLFYFRDFLVSTALMSEAQVGGYIRVMSHLADKGPLSLQNIKSISPIEFDAIIQKLQINDAGLYYSQRLDEVMAERSAFRESRLNNLKGKHKAPHMGNHMEARMGNGNGDGNKDAIKQDDGVKGKKEKKIVTYVKDNPPTVEEIGKYCFERKNGIDSQTFHDKNTTIGWIDKNKIPYRDWKAVVRTWENYRKATATPSTPPAPAKRPIALVVLEKIALKKTDHEIMQELVGIYSEHAIIESCGHARGKVV